MVVRPLWLLVMACGKGPAPSSATQVPTTAETAAATSTADTAGPSPTGAGTGETASSGTTTAQTGPTGVRSTAHTGTTSTADTAVPFRAPGDPLEPYARIYGASFDSGSARGDDDHDLLLVDIELPVPGYKGPSPHIAVLDGMPPAGDHDVNDLWNGTSLVVIGSAGARRLFHMQEDANGDGIRDYWVGDRLFAGPITGPALDLFDDYLYDYLARMEPFDLDDPASPSTEGIVIAAGFDADGDGHDDILVGSGATEHQNFIHYGPFSGIIPSGRLGHAPEASSISYDGCTHTSESVHFIPDFLGPGRPGIKLGGSDPAHECNPDHALFPLDLPRGTHVPYATATANIGWSAFLPVGDVDGDGRDDFSMSYLLDQDGLTLASPFEGFFDFINVHPLVETRFGRITHPVGDINGDGIDDIGGRWDDASSSVVLLSPHPPGPVDLSRGVQLPLFRYSDDYNLLTTGDFDGDGKTDLVYAPYTRPWEEDHIAIYTGAQLTEAWNALHGIAPDDTSDDTSDTATP